MNLQNNLHDSLLKTGEMLDNVDPNSLTPEQVVELLKTQSNLESLRDSIVLSMTHHQTIKHEQAIVADSSVKMSDTHQKKVSNNISIDTFTPYNR